MPPRCTARLHHRIGTGVCSALLFALTPHRSCLVSHRRERSPERDHEGRLYRQVSHTSFFLMKRLFSLTLTTTTTDHCTPTALCNPGAAAMGALAPWQAVMHPLSKQPFVARDCVRFVLLCAKTALCTHADQSYCTSAEKNIADCLDTRACTSRHASLCIQTCMHACSHLQVDACCAVSLCVWPVRAWFGVLALTPATPFLFSQTGHVLGRRRAQAGA